jgi:hypothetical protein
VIKSRRSFDAVSRVSSATLRGLPGTYLVRRFFPIQQREISERRYFVRLLSAKAPRGNTFWRRGYGYICHRKWSANRMQSQVYLSFAEVKPTFALQISETTEFFLSIKGYLLPIRVPEPASQVPLSVVSDIWAIAHSRLRLGNRKPAFIALTLHENSDETISPEPPCCQKVYPRSVHAEQRRVKERRFLNFL